MRKTILLFLSAFTLLACNSNSEIKDNCLKIYQEGTEKVKKAKTQKEINDISYDVAKKFSDIGNSPDGDIRLSPSDQAELLNAQQNFYQMIESRAKEVTPLQADSNVILRTER